MAEPLASEADFLAGGGQMGSLIRARDWTQTPLGPPGNWPQSLRSALSICLHSSFPTAIYWGAELRLLYNDAWAPIPGDRHPEALGRPGEQVWADIWDVVGPQLTHVLETGEGFSTFDQMLPMLRGGAVAETYWNYSFTAIRGEDGRVVGVFNQGHETTDRVLASRESAAKTERMRAMFDEAPGVIAMLRGRDHVFELTNRAFGQLIGHRDVVGKPVRDALPELEGQGFFRLLDQVFASGESYVGRAVAVDLQRRTGAPTERRFVDFVYQPVLDAGGTVSGIFVEGHDVTERVAAEEELLRLNATLEQRVETEVARGREADALYRAYFENAPEALFVVGVHEDGRFVAEEINPAHEASVGFAIDQIRGKAVGEFLPPAAAEKIIATYRRVVETRSIYQYREVFDLDGGPQHWDTSLVPVLDDDGRVRRIMGASRNITPQIRAEEALRQSQKMESMGQLTGGVAHDFNNLLTPIVGALDLLQRKGVGADREQRMIAGAAQAAERAKILVQRLLAFARRQPLQPVAVDVAGLVRGMGDLVSSTTGPQIRVVVDVAEDLPPALADPNQIEMALLNLSVNARDAMPNGGTLRISATPAEVPPGNPVGLSPGTYVKLSVADTGIGMDEATLARSIEPFFSTKGVGRGTGLGLSMVHGLALQLGGNLTIQSQPGLGTNVELWLPRSEASPATEAAQEAEPGVAPRGTVLLVDDEELVRMSTADLLGDLGYRVVEAASGEEALRLVGDGLAFDLLVTDHLMPGINGTDLAREVQSRAPGTRVLIVSGYAESERLDPDLPRLTKPFRRDELLASLGTLESAI